MPRKLKITVDLNICVGNAMCETFATHTFALNEDRQSTVVNAEGDPEEQVLEAAENCPVTRHHRGRRRDGGATVPLNRHRLSARQQQALPQIAGEGF